MLVTLGTNQSLSAGGSNTFPYACRSVQKIFIKIDDASGETGYDAYVTVQLGQRTIVNGAWMYGLNGYQILQGGYDQTGKDNRICIDLGSHQLLDNENLYVTVRAGAAALDAVDVSALVDASTGNEYPVRYTEYSDNTFTAENVLTAISFASARSSIDEDNYNCEIRDAVNSSSPNFISANNWFSVEAVAGGNVSAYGLLKKDVVPLTTTFNYSASAKTDRILVASLMGTNQRAVSQGRRQSAIAQSQVGK